MAGLLAVVVWEAVVEDQPAEEEEDGEGEGDGRD